MDWLKWSLPAQDSSEDWFPTSPDLCAGTMLLVLLDQGGKSCCLVHPTRRASKFVGIKSLYESVFCR